MVPRTTHTTGVIECLTLPFQQEAVAVLCLGFLAALLSKFRCQPVLCCEHQETKIWASSFCRKRPGKDKEAEMELGLSAGKPSHGSTVQMHTHKESFNKNPKYTAFLV